MEAFKAPQKAIDWAKVCLETGYQASARYFKDGAFALVVENDLDARQRITKFKLIKAPPPDVEGPFRNAIVDIKHSFDQSLYAAAHTMGCLRFTQNYPWADTLPGVKGIIGVRQMKEKSRLPQTLIDEILRQQPHATGPGFPGGDDLIREIAHMANDKHTIGFTAAAAATSLTITNIHIGSSPGGNISFGHNWDPVKKEMIVSKIVIGASVTQDYPKITGNIFLERAGRIGKIPVYDLGVRFAERAQIVLDGFKAICA